MSDNKPQTTLTDREYILSLVREDGGVPEIKVHNDRLRMIAGRLDELEAIKNAKI